MSKAKSNYIIRALKIAVILGEFTISDSRCNITSYTGFLSINKLHKYRLQRDVNSVDIIPLSKAKINIIPLKEIKRANKYAFPKKKDTKPVFISYSPGIQEIMLV